MKRSNVKFVHVLLVSGALVSQAGCGFMHNRRVPPDPPYATSLGNKPNPSRFEAGFGAATQPSPFQGYDAATSATADNGALNQQYGNMPNGGMTTSPYSLG